MFLRPTTGTPSLWKAVESCGRLWKLWKLSGRHPLCAQIVFAARCKRFRRAGKPLPGRNKEAGNLPLTRVSPSYFGVVEALVWKHQHEELEMAATIPAGSKFVHRCNHDGTIDSICRECFVTVATSKREVDLERSERMHACDPWTVDRFKELAKPDPGLSNSGGARQPDRRHELKKITRESPHLRLAG